MTKYDLLHFAYQQEIITSEELKKAVLAEFEPAGLFLSGAEA